jgi:hypothetical protein
MVVSGFKIISSIDAARMITEAMLSCFIKRTTNEMQNITTAMLQAAMGRSVITS